MPDQILDTRSPTSLLLALRWSHGHEAHPRGAAAQPRTANGGSNTVSVDSNIHGNSVRRTIGCTWLSGSTRGQAHGSRDHRTAGGNFVACRVSRIWSGIGFVPHDWLQSNGLDWKLEREVSDCPG